MHVATPSEITARPTHSCRSRCRSTEEQAHTELPYRTREMCDFLDSCSERSLDSPSLSNSPAASSANASSEQSTTSATEDALTTPNRARLPAASHCRRPWYACTSSPRSASFRPSTALQYTGGFPSALQRTARRTGRRNKSPAHSIGKTVVTHTDGPQPPPSLTSAWRSSSPDPASVPRRPASDWTATPPPPPGLPPEPSAPTGRAVVGQKGASPQSDQGRIIHEPLYFRAPSVARADAPR